jgi:hypothetical protein
MARQIDLAVEPTKNYAIVSAIENSGRNEVTGISHVTEEHI